MKQKVEKLKKKKEKKRKKKEEGYSTTLSSSTIKKYSISLISSTILLF